MSRKHLILLGTHEHHIHSVVFDEDAKTLVKTSSLKTAEQPSWITQHPSHKDIIYSNGWVDGKAFALRVVDDQGKLEVISEATTGGPGATHIAVLPDESAIVLAHYTSGQITLIPLSPDGTFSSPHHIHAHSGKYTPQNHPRQEASHMHHIAIHDNRLYVPDLGSNVVWIMNASVKDGFSILGKVDWFEPGDGPRHVVVHPSGEYLYTLCELSSYLVIHRLIEGGIPSPQARLIKRLSILPPADDPHHRDEMLACEIILCRNSHSPGTGEDLLICSNRDSPNPEGDALALFSVSADGGAVRRAPTPWITGVGKHLRAVEQSKDGRFVCVSGRNGGGVKIFERVGKDGMEMEEVAKLEDLELTTCPVWV